LKQTNSKWSTG